MRRFTIQKSEAKISEKTISLLGFFFDKYKDGLNATLDVYGKSIERLESGAVPPDAIDMAKEHGPMRIAIVAVYPEKLADIPENERCVRMERLAIRASDSPLAFINLARAAISVQIDAVAKHPWRLAEIPPERRCDEVVITAILASDTPLECVDIDNEPLYIQQVITEKFPGMFPVAEKLVELAKNQIDEKKPFHRIIPRQYLDHLGISDA